MLCYGQVHALYKTYIDIVHIRKLERGPSPGPNLLPSHLT